MNIHLIGAFALAVVTGGVLGCGGQDSAPRGSVGPGPAVGAGPEGPRGRPAGARELPEATRSKLEKAATAELNRLQTEIHAETVPDATAPGGAEVPAPLTLEKPVVFSSIPAASLLELEEGPGGAAARRAEGAVESLLDRSELRVIYPVKRGDRVVRSMLFRLAGEDDAPGAASPDFVSAKEADPFTLLVWEAQRKHAAAAGRPEADYKGVSVFSLNQHFLYFKEGNQEMMMPIASDPALGFKAGQPLPAGEVLEKLRKQLATEVTGEEAPG